MAADAPTPTEAQADSIEIWVPLRPEFGATVRTVAASLGADVGFSVDELDDLRLALSEVFSVMVDLGDPDQARLVTTFSVAPGAITATMASDSLAGHIELDDLASSILRSVVDDHQVAASSITLVKSAAEAADRSLA